MDRYKLIKEVGDGTLVPCGELSISRRVKLLQLENEKEVLLMGRMYQSERSESLRRMDHPNIVKLKEVIREHDILYFDYNLYQLMKDRQKLFTEAVIKKWCFQVFQSFMAFLICISEVTFTAILSQIADFGLAREVIRVHLLPSMFLHADMWAMGAIMSELLSLRPYFQGLVKQMRSIRSALSGVPLSSLMPSASEDAIDLITRLCSWDPCKRPTAAEALQHPFFQSCFYVPPSLRPKPSVARTPPPVGPRGSFEHPTVKRQTCLLPSHSTIFSKPSAAFGSGVQRKLDMAKQDGTRNPNRSVKDSKYRPPGRKSPPGGNAAGSSLSKNRVARGVSETADKLSNMSVRGTVSRRHSVSVMQQQQLKPPPMKARLCRRKTSSKRTAKRQANSFLASFQPNKEPSLDGSQLDDTIP
ncbi:LOW QUALITY PROTEIN: hypothetical protein HID58_090232 [Brassica napus]|uniref:Protein kinase domain-containing protein n=1 Tax=Brassica napus TaxID=3708 RepID=A0ABQ7XAB7_BRANA|nr:LOW QUALITY PROTEIN: hypothetical protein HID58_090232 [Brassica napus]